MVGSKLTGLAPNQDMVLPMRRAGASEGWSRRQQDEQRAASTSSSSPSSPSRGGGATAAAKSNTPSTTATTTTSSTAPTSVAAPIADPSKEVDVIIVNLTTKSITRRPNAVGLKSEVDIGLELARAGAVVVHQHHGSDKIVYVVEAEGDAWEKSLWE